MNHKEIVAQLLKNGAELVKELTITGISVKILPLYARLTIYVNAPIKEMTTNDEGDDVEHETKSFTIEAFKLRHILSETKNLEGAADYLIKHPYALSLVLNKAKINLLQDKAQAETVYTNPFSDSNDTVTYTSTRFVNHVVFIDPSSIDDIELAEIKKDMRTMSI